MSESSTARRDPMPPLSPTSKVKDAKSKGGEKKARPDALPSVYNTKTRSAASAPPTAKGLYKKRDPRARRSSLVSRGGKALAVAPPVDDTHSHNVWLERPIESWPSDLLMSASFTLGNLPGALRTLAGTVINDLKVLGPGRFEAKVNRAGHPLVLELRAGNLECPDFKKPDIFSDLDWRNIVSGKITQ